ncbi:MAG: hypothetical protein OXI48_11260 [bacterium]|nr:hypothetical protein [bacterium]
MPTHEEETAFLRDFRQLTASQREEFSRALARFVDDLREMEAGRREWFRPSTVRKLSGAKGRYELRWAPDGRATFSIGVPQRAGAIHIQWRRCGTHDILP